MNFKKTLSAILAGVMLIGGAVSVSAGNVYTSEDIRPVVNPYIPYYYNYYLNNGLYGNLIYDGYRLEATWNPITGSYTGGIYYPGYTTPSTVVPSGYYWINGNVCSAEDYYVKYAPSTVKVEPVKEEVTEKTETKVTFSSSAYRGIIKSKKAASTTTSADKNVVITESGNITIKNPLLIGGINTSVTIPGKYYPCGTVSIDKFFENNTYSMYLYPGDIQTFGTGFKMISSNSAAVQIVNDKDGQHLKAVAGGSAYVYLYTGGGVPFMRLYVNVGGKAYNTVQGYLDIQPASWRLEKSGESTDIVVKADKEYKDIKLEVVKGNGYIGNDGKLYATGNGAIVLRASSASYKDVQGYAIVYVGQYINALYDGYWTSNNGFITGSYWNPYLWGYDGYKIVGWVVTTDGTYLPVISKEVTVVKPETDPDKKPDENTIIISNLYELLYTQCHGDVNTLYQLLWLKYNANKPAQSFDSLYQAALKEIMEDIAASYDKQIH